MSKYHKLSKELQEQILSDRQLHKVNPYCCKDEDIIRSNPDWDKANLWRPAFVRDVEKIMHSPYYNRYADKTQVFSFLSNDDITRRALHVQLVSRIARNIGSILGLNLDLIEAIALGHDIGHTPFGHAGERYLNEMYHRETGRFFNHNVQSVRVLHGVFPRNLSLQTLDGILCHNGEFELKEYRPSSLKSFDAFDQKLEECYVDDTAIKRLIPSTLEGCVVRICDMIAYLGKDRQDARKAKLLKDSSMFTEGEMGIENAEIINNLIVNIVENSYGKDFIQLDEPYYDALKLAKQENYREIYCNEAIDSIYENNVGPMIRDVYEMLLDDMKHKRENSIIYKHHIEFVEEARSYYLEDHPYGEEEENQIVVDYIASMTDDYFIDLYQYLFPNGKYHVDYVSYFEGPLYS